MTMTRDKIEELKRLAEEATQDGWFAYNPSISPTVNPQQAWFLNGPQQISVDRLSGFRAEDAQFIAAANPKTILSLLALAERALEPQGQALPVAEVFHYDGITYAELREPITVKPGDLLYASQLALPAGQVLPAVDGVHWDQFPAYLIDKCEGSTIYEESMQQWLADMLKDPDYIRIAAERASPSPAVAQPVPEPSGYVNLEKLARGMVYATKWQTSDKQTPFYTSSPAVAQPVADERDAGRYRWLKSQCGQEHHSLLTVQHELDGIVSGADLDSAIDAARAALCQPAEEGDKA